ncbi:MAG TPA: DUF4124 domain-containing protein [Pelomicrobium sp.]|nr:DUF4124 domain-containing protein [Pelomicrobium sp.]
MTPARALAAALLLAAAGSAHADIYKHVDEEGRITFTNIYRKGAVKVETESGTRVEAAKPNAAARKAAPKPVAVSPASFPRVSAQTQKQRDDERRRILEHELTSENQLLEQARRALAEGKVTRPGDERNDYQGYISRVQRLMETVQLHEQNVLAIQQEISLLR